MYGSWLGFAFAFIISGILLYFPGYLMSRAIGIRGFLAVSVAPLISIGFVSTLAVLLGALRIKWSVWILFACIFLTCFLLFIINGGGIYNRALIFFKAKFYPKTYANSYEIIPSRVGKTSRVVISWCGLFVPLCVGLVAGFVLFVRVLLALRVPFAFSQSSDGHYHYNSVASMLESGDLSSLHMLQLPPNSSFYPAAWHDFVTSVIHVTGVSIPVAANAFTYFLLCFVWPLSMLTFALCISKNKVFLSVVAGTSTLISFFPGIYLTFGILYANITAAVVLPVVFMIVVSFLFRQRFFGFWQVVFLGVTSLLALAFAQSSGIFTVYYVVLIVLPFAGYKLGKEFDVYNLGFKDFIFGVSKTKTLNDSGSAGEIESHSYKYRIIFTALAFLVLFAIIAAVTYISLTNPSIYNARFTSNIVIPTRYGRKEALLAFLTTGQRFLTVPGDQVFYENIYVSVLCFIGLGVILRRHFKTNYLWIIVAWIWFSFLNFIAASWPDNRLRAFLTGIYYGEPIRLISIQVIFMVIIIALAVMFMLSKLKLLAYDSGKYGFKIFGAITLVLLFIVAQVIPAYSYRFVAQNISFSLPESNLNNELVYSKSEVDFMQSNTDKIDKSYNVIGNPFKGTTASWFLFGQRNVMYHIQHPRDEYRQILSNNLEEINTNPKVCKAIKKYKVRYVYSFVGKCQWGRDCDREYPSFDNLDNKPFAKLINKDKYGNKLFEINGCDNH
ncbi:hypothetical protein HCQ94_00475 [Actinomyces sp. zg-332]|uniref:DUF6541 family protein n=1 Tax=Actinomyces sp. zg-332 TaxID=2708340 RepID=UPI0018C34E0C|nr:DUF6541 family protein [Actinomyces sp. zg-332]QPK94229.1 hypothetical protein HCQ94_00475 [Actinomyces sp. zg-332]